MTFESVFGSSRIRRARRPIAVLMALAALVSSALSGTAAGDEDVASPSRVSVIVRERPGAGARPEKLVEALGGRVGRHIAIVDGFEAEVAPTSVDDVARSRFVQSVTPNSRVRMLQFSPGFDAAKELGSMYNVVKSIGAPFYWQRGYTGRGVDIAVLDTGVSPVPGLTTPGKVINAVDLSFESQAPHLRYMDTFGHGTNMAAIAAGRDPFFTTYAVPGPNGVPTPADTKNFGGVAPDARIINVKVADAEGSSDVSQVLAAIDWVVHHRKDNGMNIRVLNLSFGTDGIQDYRLDPLTYAAEVAWRKGIVVVVSGGNAGYGSAKLNNPAYDPFVLAVGSVVNQGTPQIADDRVAPYSSTGDGGRNPDLVAPGQSVVSLRVPGSYLDQHYPAGVIGDRFFRGSGTSQAAAIVSGAAALVLQQRPTATPDQVKKLLTSTATKLMYTDQIAQGAGMINLGRAIGTPTPAAGVAAQAFQPAYGTGSIAGARGSMVLSDGGVDLLGEQDIFGNPWSGPTWAVASLAGTSWSGGLWNGAAWSGDCWCGLSWSGRSWSGRSWSGRSWSGRSWSSIDWSGQYWSGRSWSGRSWSGRSWSGRSWSGNTWSGAGWGL